MHLRVTRNMPDPDRGSFARANVLNYWAAKLGRPLLLTRHCQPEADALLHAMNAASVLVVPLFVRNRVMGLAAAVRRAYRQLLARRCPTALDALPGRRKHAGPRLLQ